MHRPFIQTDVRHPKKTRVQLRKGTVTYRSAAQKRWRARAKLAEFLKFEILSEGVSLTTTSHLRYPYGSSGAPRPPALGLRPEALTSRAALSKCLATPRSYFVE
eukprot:scaffold106285_cov69-Phaeocystis_antarctica.AAC.3